MSEDRESFLTPLQRVYLERNPDASLSDDGRAQASDEPPTLVGVEGWLFFLAISLVALGPLVTVAQTTLEFSNLERLYPDTGGTTRWNAAFIAGWVATVAYCAISIFAGWCLFRRHVPSTVWIVIACIWLMGPALAVIGLLVAQDVSGSGATGANAGASLGRPLVYSTIWTIYLLRSKRVRNTFRDASSRQTLRERMTRPVRQFIFFSACWVVLAFAYFNFVSPPDPYADDGPNTWAITLLPPLLVGVGAWAYRKFVGSTSE